MAVLSPVAKQRFFSAAGLPAAGYKLYTYATGTSTPQAAYTDRAGSSAHTNPIILDAAGYVPSGLYLTEGLVYDYVLKTAADVTEWTRPGIVGGEEDVRHTVLEYIPESLRPAVVAGTNTTDLTDYIQAAFDAHENIEFTDGVYLGNGLTFAGKRIFGTGTIKRYGNGASPMLSCTADGVEVKGVCFDGNSADNTQTGTQIEFEGSGSYLVGCEITNFYGRIVGLLGENCTVAGNWFHDIGIAPNCNLVDMKAAGCKFVWNQVNDVTGDGHVVRVGHYASDPVVSVHSFVLANNVIRDTSHVGFVFELGANRGTTVGNVFENTGTPYKTDTTDASIYDLTFIGNVVIEPDHATALNLDCPGVIYQGNRHYGCINGMSLGDRCQVTGNYFNDCGPIRHAIAPNSALFADNIIAAPTSYGVQTSGNMIVRGNIFRGAGSASSAIRVGGSNNVISGNIINGWDRSVHPLSGMDKTIITGNIATDCPNDVDVTPGTAEVHVRDNSGFGKALGTRTIASGAITVNTSSTFIAVDTEAAAAADDLDTINGGGAGQILVLKATSSGRAVTFKDGTGNLRLSGDFVTANANDTITLVNYSAAWLELSRNVS